MVSRLLKSCATASSQASDRVHFLRLQQLRLEPESFGQIAPVRYEMRDLPVRIAYRTDALLDIVQFAILLAVDQDSAKHASAEDRLPHFLINLWTLLPGFQNPRSFSMHFVEAISGQGFERRVDVFDGSR